MSKFINFMSQPQNVVSKSKNLLNQSFHAVDPICQRINETGHRWEIFQAFHPVYFEPLEDLRHECLKVKKNYKLF